MSEPSPAWRRAEVLLVVALLAVHWTLAVTSSVDKSATFDETAHLAAGYLYWTTGDYRFNPESGNLTQRWAALPLLGRDLAVPPPELPARRQGNVWLVGQALLYRLGNDADALLLAARAMIALLSVALGALVYGWSRSLFGRRGALLSLALYVWSPTVLAHARLVTADLAAALFLLLGVTALDRFLRRLGALRLLAAAGAVGALVLAKMSGLLILPMAALLAAVRWRGVRGGDRLRRLGALVALAALVTAMVWAAYGFRYRAAGDADPGGTFVHSWESRLAGAGGPAPVIRLARRAKLLPEAYLWGLAYTLLTTRGRDAFLNGEVRTTGWRHYFPYAFLVKTPLALVGLLLLAAAAGAAGRHRLRDGLGRAAPLAVLAGVYSAVVLNSSLNVGHRHLLPLYPLLFIAAGGAALWLDRRLGAVAIVLLAGLFVVDSQRVRPHYLAFFNVLAGGPENAYRHLVDSSLDWGQDLPALADRLRELRAAEADVPIYVAYFGTAVPKHYGVEARWLHSYFVVEVPHPPRPLEGGFYAVSATLLQTLHTGRAGEWTPAFEQEYQALCEGVARVWATDDDPAARRALLGERPRQAWTKLFAEYNRLRSVRLFHVLQGREPDARAGYSILIYRLSDAEVEVCGRYQA